MLGAHLVPKAKVAKRCLPQLMRCVSRRLTGPVTKWNPWLMARRLWVDDDGRDSPAERCSAASRRNWVNEDRKARRERCVVSLGVGF